MKNTFKKLTALSLAAAAAVSLYGCSQKEEPAPTGGEEPASYTVGVIQYAPHPSLDNCYNGLVTGLEEAGYIEGENLEIDLQNAQGDPSTGDLIAKSMVAKQYDLIVAIATPAAMSAYGAAKDTDIPVVFLAVSDPVLAGIVQSIEAPGNNCTGSADILPVRPQLEMIRAFMPDAKTIGILYTVSEPNSLTQLAEITAAAPDYGFEIVSVGVTNASEVAAGASTLVSKDIDCINNFTDNNIVNNLSLLMQAAGEKNIPVFGSEIEQLKSGCLAAQNLDYVALGVKTGGTVAKVLSGESKAGEIPVYQATDCEPVYNPDVLEAFSMTLPAAYENAAAVTAETEN
ncbi:MAG TPA: ABC transporter substrate-binding protein [Candidatus Acidoferrum sp.]|nr:ABC transporter substrate-binding protein [Candidatus Acidoferrum sp.]